MIPDYPVITYREGITGRAHRPDLPRSRACSDIVMSALDSDVIKTYVEPGLGIGIVAPSVFDAARDTKLRLLNAACSSKS